MRIFEALFTMANIAFIFSYIFTFDLDSRFSLMVLLYLSVFLWLLVLNYFFEGLKLSAILYMIAHPALVYSEMAEQDHLRGISLGMFIAISITAMTMVLFLAPSPNVPIQGHYSPGY